MYSFHGSINIYYIYIKKVEVTTTLLHKKKKDWINDNKENWNILDVTLSNWQTSKPTQTKIYTHTHISVSIYATLSIDKDAV